MSRRVRCIDYRLPVTTLSCVYKNKILTGAKRFQRGAISRVSIFANSSRRKYHSRWLVERATQQQRRRQAGRQAGSSSDSDERSFGSARKSTEGERKRVAGVCPRFPNGGDRSLARDTRKYTEVYVLCERDGGKREIRENARRCTPRNRLCRRETSVSLCSAVCPYPDKSCWARRDYGARREGCHAYARLCPDN